LLTVGGCGSGGGGTAHLPHWVGFNDISIGYRLASPEADAALAAGAGARVERVTLDWRQIEPAPGRFAWRPNDALHAALRRHGIRPLPVLLFAPNWTWVGGSNCGSRAPWCAYPPAPEHDGDWARFAAAAARRYRDAAAIEVWNEPNLHAFWGPAPDPVRYARLLQIAQRSVRALSPSVPVLVGGLGTGAPGAGDVAADQFLKDAQAAAGSAAFDGVGVHLYPGRGGAAAVPALLDPIRRVTRKPIWVTEVGISSAGPPWLRSTLEQAQAAGLVSLLRDLARTSGIAAIVFHTLIDRPGPPGDLEAGYGVMRGDLTPKPAYCRLAAALRGGVPTRGCPR
jgi:hypothetical protein